MTMQTRFLDWQTAMRELAAPWSALVQRTRLNPSLDPRWMNAVLVSHGIAQQAQVAAFWEGNELRGVLPFICSRTRIFGIGLNTVRVCSNFVSYHAEIIAPGHEAQLLEAVLAHAHGGRWHLLEMSNVTDGSATESVLRTLVEQRASSSVITEGETSPYIVINESWESYLRGRNTKFRSNFNRVARRVEDGGPARVAWFEGSNDQGLLELILDVEQRSWKAGAGIAISGRAQETEYYRQLLPVLAQMDALFANVLFVNDKPAAYVLCCRYEGWVGQLKTSFDESVQHSGARVIDTSVQHAFERGVSTYDFLGKATPHKLKWTDTVRSHHNYWIYSRALAPRLVGALKKLNARFFPAPADAGPARPRTEAPDSARARPEEEVPSDGGSTRS